MLPKGGFLWREYFSSSSLFSFLFNMQTALAKGYHLPTICRSSSLKRASLSLSLSIYMYIILLGTSLGRAVHMYRFVRYHSAQSSSVQDGICMRSTPSLRFPSVAFGTVAVLVRLTMILSRPFKEDGRALPPSTPLSSR